MSFKDFRPERLTVTLLAKVSRELDEAAELAGLSRTDVVNRAITLYQMYEVRRAEGWELAFYNPEKDVWERMLIHKVDRNGNDEESR